GAKAPAIAKVADQVEKVQRATGRATATELLNLAALMAQVRGAQAALPAAEAVDTPLSSVELGALVGALVNAPGIKHRPRVLRDLIERDAVRDLRVLPFCV